MGAFDSYHIAWGQDSREIQTKQFISWLRGYGFGDRAPLSEWDPDDPDVPLPDDLQRRDFPFFVLGEHSGAPQEPMLWALGHLHGVLVDWVAGSTLSEIEQSARAMARAWSGPCALGLRRHVDLLSEKKRADQEALAQARQEAQGLFVQRRRVLLEERRLREDPEAKISAWTRLASYFGPPIAGLSRLQVDAALDEIDRSRSPRDPMDIHASGEPRIALPPTHAQAVALWSLSRRVFSAGSQALCAESLGRQAEPERLDGQPTPERAARLLREGFWRLFEADALALGPAFNPTEALNDLCLSRLGAHWASGLFARLPWLAPQAIEPAPGACVPLLEWLGCRVGLPDDRLLPLAAQGCLPTPRLCAEAIAQRRDALAQACAQGLGGWKTVAGMPWAGGSMIEWAARSSHVFALDAFAGSLDSLDATVQRAAIEAEEQAQWAPIFGADGSLDAPLACLDFLMSRFRAPAADAVASKRMPEFLAWREQRELRAAAAPAASRKAGVL